MATHKNWMPFLVVFDNLLLLRFPKWGVTYLYVETNKIYTQPNHLHCALIMRSKARLFTIYESDANKVTFHSTL